MSTIWGNHFQGSDPSQFENIQKIHTLQKRLISKTEEVVEKELLIQEKEKLYLELKHILARQPGPEVAEQLSIYQQTLKEKTKQMKVSKPLFFVISMQYNNNIILKKAMVPNWKTKSYVCIEKT